MERLNDLDDINMCVRNYACSRLGLFDPLISVSSPSVPLSLQLHRTFANALDPNPSRTHAKFLSPERLSVETVDGFLATCSRLVSSEPNLFFFKGLLRGVLKTLEFFQRPRKHYAFIAIKGTKHDH
jgi:hypothetical protein